MASAAYHVIGSAMPIETRLNDSGTGIEDVHVVTYMIDSGPARGQKRTVKVPDANWNTGDVKAAIEGDLETAHGVAGLRQA